MFDIHVLNIYLIHFQIVKKYAFQKQKFRDDPNCDIDFETMRLVKSVFRSPLFVLLVITMPAILSILEQ